MIIKFWGTRGSLPVPGQATVRYGGNTTCISVHTRAGETLILDAGTGIRPLGEQLSREVPVRCSLFISHTHWDHIHGLPFFCPLFEDGNRVDVYGAFDPVTRKGIKSLLSDQMAYPHFPVRINELEADVDYRSLTEGQTIQIGTATVTTVHMHHTALTYGLRVECDGGSIFFTADHEPFRNIHKPGEEGYEEYQAIVDRDNDRIREQIAGVDLLIADAQYTEQEYETKAGWGPSTHDRSVDLARSAGVGSLYMTHHEINRTDDELDGILARIRDQNHDEKLEIHMAREGMEIEL